MKATFFLVLALVIACFALGLTACVTTTSTAKDGTVTTIKAPAPGVLPFAAATITAYSPRPIVVRQEKSGPVSRGYLRGWRGHTEMAHHVEAKTGRISKEEIQQRRK